uniref:AAA domain-containing protein n=1 Tax=Angiostrongylus cantonensis TaxID=6313 RepID=A0A0K0D912_ANGCA
MFSMHIAEYSIGEALEWLRNFSALIERTASRGKYVSNEEISKSAFTALPYEDCNEVISAPTNPIVPLQSSSSVIEDGDEMEVAYMVGSRRPKPDDALDTFCNSRRYAKTAFFEALVDPVQYPEWFAGSDIKPWKTVLLYGPPGTGESHQHRRCLCQIVSSSDLISTWSGQSERLIRELFDHAIAQKRTAVMFIDEVDSLCRTRCASEDDANRRVKTELLLQMQRLQTTSNVVLVCATNCPWDLDPAFLRRFEKKIYVGLPDLQSRIAMLKARLQNTTIDPSVSMEWIGDATNGFSADDIRRFAVELAYTQFRYYKGTGQSNSKRMTRKALSREDIESVLASFSTSVDKKQLARFEKYRNM